MLKRPLMFVASLAVAFVTSQYALGAATPPAWQVLFDGRSLENFDLVTCQAVVRDGVMLLESGNGLVQTKQQYADFALEFEWKALRDEQYDSGVYFRYESIKPPRPWPQQYQVNLRQGQEGAIPGLDSTITSGLVRPGDWNRFRLTVRGKTATLAINGKPAWKTGGIESPHGFIGFQAEVPGGGQFLFRNIRIREFTSPSATSK